MRLTTQMASSPSLRASRLPDITVETSTSLRCMQMRPHEVGRSSSPRKVQATRAGLGKPWEMSVVFAKALHREGLFGPLGVEFPHEGIEAALLLRDVA